MKQDECEVMHNCKNAGAGCDWCVMTERGPSKYLPRDPKIKHSVTVAWLRERAQQRRTAKRSNAARKARSARRKGKAGEREVARLVGGSRIPLSGSLGGQLSGDVLLPNGWRAEVKRRKRIGNLYTWLQQGEQQPDLLFVRADNERWLVVMDLEHFQSLL